MKRARKILLIAAAVLVVLVGILIAAIFILPETDALRDRVQQELADRTGQEILLGSIRVLPSFSDVITLRMAGISVQTPDGKVLFSADEVHFQPDVKALLNGEISVDSVSIERFRTTVLRNKDGTVSLPFVPVPLSADDTERKPAPESKPDKPTPPGPGETQSASEDGLQWSIKEIEFRDGAVDWVDHAVDPNNPVKISLSGISGKLARPDSNKPLQANLTWRIGSGDTVSRSGKLHGTVDVSPGYSQVKGATINVAAEEIPVKPFTPYLPREARIVSRFDTVDMDVHIAWGGAESPNIALKASWQQNETRGAKLDVDANARLTRNLDGVDFVRFSAETDHLPVKFLQGVLPSDVPFDPNRGSLTGSVTGETDTAGNWKAQGTVSADDMVPRGDLAFLGTGIRVWGELKADPTELVLENVQVSDSRNIASIDGSLSQPFTGNPELNLRAKVRILPEWLKHWGVKLPPGAALKGAFPVQAAVRGKPDDLWFDCSGDLSETSFQFPPYLTKSRGSKGAFSLKGGFGRSSKGGNTVTKLRADSRIDLTGITLRMSDRTPVFSDCVVQFDGKVHATGNRVAVKQASLAIRRGKTARALFTAEGGVSGLGSGKPRFDAEGSVRFDPSTLAFAGVEIPPEMRIKGQAPLYYGVRGNPEGVDWTMRVPLLHLDIRVKDAFVKPAGIKGELTGSGSWDPQETDLKDGALKLPGVRVSATGLLRDKTGNLGDVTIKVPTVRIDEIKKYVQPMKDVALSGPLAASVRLRQGEKGVLANGTCSLLGMTFGRSSDSVTIIDIKGNVDFKGEKLWIPRITANVRGVIKGPLTLNGALENIGDTKTVSGNLSMEMGKGFIRPGSMANLIGAARTAIGIALDPSKIPKQPHVFKFDFARGDLIVKSGTAQTDNFRLKGERISAGAVGTLHLDSQRIDTVAAVKTVMEVSDVLGRIPAVKDFVKQHEGILKATGIDRELKRFGIGGSDSGEDEKGRPGTVKSDVLVTARIQGPLSGPNVRPVPESAIDKRTLSRLKPLLK